MSGTQGTDWKQLAPDPDPVDDLGYEPDNWQQYESETAGQRHVVFVPSEKSEQDAFVVAEESAVTDLIDEI